MLVEHLVGGGLGEAFGEGFFGTLCGFDGIRAGGIELDAIAGRNQKRFVEAPLDRDLAELLLEAIGRYSETLPDLYGCGSVRQADHHEVAHQALAPTARSA